MVNGPVQLVLTDGWSPQGPGDVALFLRRKYGDFNIIFSSSLAVRDDGPSVIGGQVPCTRKAAEKKDTKESLLCCFNVVNADGNAGQQTFVCHCFTV